MFEITNYIFKSLYKSEGSIKRINRILRNQAKLNQSLKIFAFVVTANNVLTFLNNQQMKKEIYKLKKEIENLKRSEGE